VIGESLEAATRVARVGRSDFSTAEIVCLGVAIFAWSGFNWKIIGWTEVFDTFVLENRS